MYPIIRTVYWSLSGLVLVNYRVAGAIFDAGFCFSLLNEKFVQKCNMSTYSWSSPVLGLVTGGTFRVRKIVTLVIHFLDFRLKRPCGAASN